MAGRPQMRVKNEGDVKSKDTEGNKLKINADDGAVKSKSPEGTKVVIK